MKFVTITLLFLSLWGLFRLVPEAEKFQARKQQEKIEQMIADAKPYQLQLRVLTRIQIGSHST